MGILDKFLDYFSSDKSIPKTSGNLADGKQTFQYAKNKKHDLEAMIKCCQAELKNMNKSGTVAAPFYFERVAILSRKNKDYQQEVDYCETYLKVVDDYYSENRIEGIADIRKGPRYKAIMKRLPNAKKLLEKQKSQS